VDTDVLTHVGVVQGRSPVKDTPCVTPAANRGHIIPALETQNVSIVSQVRFSPTNPNSLHASAVPRRIGSYKCTDPCRVCAGKYSYTVNATSSFACINCPPGKCVTACSPRCSTSSKKSHRNTWDGSCQHGAYVALDQSAARAVPLDKSAQCVLIHVGVEQGRTRMQERPRAWSALCTEILDVRLEVG